MNQVDVSHRYSRVCILNHYFVKGICDVYVDDHFVQRYDKPASFGDLALMYNSPRSATVSSLLLFMKDIVNS